MGGENGQPQLDKKRHIQYWTRCIKTLLPHQYTGNDSNRMYLAFLMVSALDLLDSLTVACSEDERCDYVNWIYRCQHPDGGFRMWPGTDFGERATEANAKWDPANIPATYFALAALLILGDDFKRVRRKETLHWIRKMQRSDGSFGETLVDGQVEGGRDPRAGYCASGIRYILGGSQPVTSDIDSNKIEDIDVDTLVRCIRQSESFDGGIADEAFHEPHAGYTFCSLGALRFVDRLNFGSDAGKIPTRGPTDPRQVLEWLVHRQTDLLDPDSALDTEFQGPPRSAKLSAHEFNELSTHQTPLMFDTQCIGMNGRTNKVADTCYAFWAGGSLHILAQPSLYDHNGIQRYLLEKTQHPVLGGFGKFPGDLPDLYHSYLGLAALSLAGGSGIKELDPGMCVSKEASTRLEGLWRAWDL